MTTQEKKRGLLLLVSVFLIGMICGAALMVVGHHLVDRGIGAHPPMHEPPMRWIKEELDLNREQMDQIHEILMEHREEMIESFEEIRARIREVLTEEQQEKFDKMRPHFMKPFGRPPHRPDHHHEDMPPEI